ncbi:redox-sensing transcriptional repressor Rex [Cellulomonas timonensis]|uniref:redox-sensing transcriptional repressor Rex n=1 Tax=Cellulomonas timonensis TaxID=1689271 RepID=UPI000B03679F|nr:redox-sensing transcriptional repressor Rex [Cellulomonas timonensis]
MALREVGRGSPEKSGGHAAPAGEREERSVPSATIARLPGYLRALGTLVARGVVTASSGVLAGLAGVRPEQLRKDLSLLGAHGRRGVGYDVQGLRAELEATLGLTRERRVVIVGVGNLGRALARYSGFPDRGFVVVGLVDSDPQVVGTRTAGLVVEPIERLAEVVRSREATIAVIATPAEAAQDVCDQLVEAGVSGILSFAPRPLQVPVGVDLRAVDLGSELQILAFHDHRRSGAGR